MVAISLYRGNLHRVPDVPRRWLTPRPRISLHDFRGLLRRRSKALSLLKAGSALVSTSAPSTVANGNPPLPPPQSLPPLPPPPPAQRRLDRRIHEEDVKPRARASSSPVPLGVDNSGGSANLKDRESEDAAAEEFQLANLASLVDGKVKAVADALSGESEDLTKAKEEDQETKNEDPEKERRKKEVEEKLEILNKKKHNLVQALKQILSAEEELKRRSSTQSARPCVPLLQLDMSNDSGSISRVATPTPRITSEANVGGNAQGGEPDDAWQSRQVAGMSSISPSAESAFKRPSY